MRWTSGKYLFSCCVVLLISNLAATSQTEKELAIQDENPLTRLVRIQIEDNAQFGFGPNEELINILRFQPIIPIGFNEDLALITRTVIPLVHQPWPVNSNGISDVSLQLFLSPRKIAGVSWGAGGVLFIPTATDNIIGTGKWSAGPAFAAVESAGAWVGGFIINQLWSFAGQDNRADLSAFTIRPLINYNFTNGWFLSSGPTIAANWLAASGNRWLIPIGGGCGKVIAIGSQKLSLLAEGYYHVSHPSIGPLWQLRIQATLLFPA